MTTALIVIALMVVGLILIAIEVLVIPGVGVIGILGGLAIIGSGYVAVTELSAAYAGITIAAGIVATAGLFWWFPRTRAAKSLVLETQTLGGAGDPTLVRLVGFEGVTVTPLRPSGTAKIDDKPVDVVADGQYVETGKKVRVILVEGSRVVVEPIS